MYLYSTYMYRRLQARLLIYSPTDPFPTCITYFVLFTIMAQTDGLDSRIFVFLDECVGQRLPNLVVQISLKSTRQDLADYVHISNNQRITTQ